MTNTDMIAWFANEKVGLTKDYWSTSHDDPEEDLTSNLITGRAPEHDSVTDKMTFVTIRALDTGDSQQDFLVPVEVNFPVSYAYAQGSAAWRKH